MKGKVLFFIRRTYEPYHSPGCQGRRPHAHMHRARVTALRQQRQKGRCAQQMDRGDRARRKQQRGRRDGSEGGSGRGGECDGGMSSSGRS